MSLRKTTTTIMLLVECFAVKVNAADLTALELERRFADTVRPFLETYCFACHDQAKQKGKLDLSLYSKMEAVAQDYRRWDLVLEKLKGDEMPPEEAERHPTPDQRRSVIDWIQTMRRFEAERNAGDPGVVLARRLSNAEYDYTIRDLTGVDIRPTQEFPVDPANEAGFDNSGESLMMSPTLLNKYLEAARRVAGYLVLKPKGFVFAPHPVVTETDRDKYCVKRIVDFYQRQPTDYADYFLAAWRFKNRAAIGKPEAGLADFAAENRISSQYLATIWSALAEAKEETGPIAALQSLWRGLPGPGDNSHRAVRRSCERMRDFVVQFRGKLKPEFKNLTLRGISNGSQPLVLWKDRQYATNRTRYAGGAWQLQPDEFVLGDPASQALAAPTEDAARERYEAAFKRFCAIFPDAFYVSERGRIFLEKDEGDRGRLLSAGFHLMVGYFRDDAPLYELVLDEPGRRELDQLWQELNFITYAPMRQYKDFIFFERAEPPRFAQGAEFDFARSEDKDATSASKIRQMAETYVAKAHRIVAESPAIDAIQYYFESISDDIRRVEEARLAAEPSHLESLLAFAQRAYRRPLTQAERDELLRYYRTLRAKEGLDHEEAIRDLVASVLMSPDFCYRIDLTEAGAVAAGFPAAVEGGIVQPVVTRADSIRVLDSRPGPPGGTPGSSAGGTPAATLGMHPLSDYALASRLSYFLWSSMPDEGLLARAAAGDLHRPEVLVGQARRLLQDQRIRGLATEFGGNWLDFRRFEEHNSVDRERFKTFNNELRQSMFEEPVRFFVNLIRDDRSVLDFLYADYIYVDAVLAKHYGMPEIGVGPGEWVRVDDAHRYERGGLLPMSVFLTKNAPGLRTSPVKRGYWVVRRLLGEYIPPPPATVPELPSDEAKLGDLTVREMLAKHREDKNCAACHAHFDSFGLVFEGFGPIGERRVKDLGGRPVDTRATFPAGGEGAGLDGLRDYLRAHRQEEFLDNLCRKLLAYALGRTLMLSDDILIHDMHAKLAAKGYRFGTLVESIVTSPQFLNKRGPDELAKR